MDFRITDPLVDPVGAKEPEAERPLRFPQTYFCFRPRHVAPIGPLPALTTGHVTFGSFNNVAKLGAATVEAWAAVLRETPGSRLLMKARGLRDEHARAIILGRFAAHGIDASRITTVGWEDDIGAHLGWYRHVDIALDTFPYNGATTTCEALHMGVPVVSLHGTRHAARCGLSLLTAIGLPQLAAADRGAFVSRAVELARDLDALAHMRSTLRGRMEASPLMDEPGQTLAFERLLKEALERRAPVQ
jgi:predicted O-linked N-acetylglucosamine transferase (SPINDLY family)